jgi:hypothetical protein
MMTNKVMEWKNVIEILAIEIATLHWKVQNQLLQFSSTIGL